MGLCLPLLTTPPYLSRWIGKILLFKEVARGLAEMNPIRLKRDVLLDSHILHQHTNRRSNARKF